MLVDTIWTEVLVIGFCPALLPSIPPPSLSIATRHTQHCTNVQPHAGDVLRARAAVQPQGHSGRKGRSRVPGEVGASAGGKRLCDLHVLAYAVDCAASRRSARKGGPLPAPCCCIFLACLTLVHCGREHTVMNLNFDFEAKKE
jgi:hypothetical protein